jgi:mono/diheme cytochrome c family protein
MLAMAVLTPSFALAQEASESLNSNAVAEGRALYLQYCASCHGVEGEGQPNWQKPNQLGELPAPPHNSEGHSWRHSDADLFGMISDGWRDPFNRTKRLTMPAFKDLLKTQEIERVITYLKTLWSPEQRQFQRETSYGQAISNPNEALKLEKKD